MPEKFFLTTPIYYINATPHIGHAYTTIAADARARFERLRGKNVYFLTGTDEHGSKVARAAQDAGVSPQDYADKIAGKFIECWKSLNISYDDFVRTTQSRHEIAAQRIVEKLWQGGHLALGSYSGWYSVPDETFFKPEDVTERDGATYLANPSIDQTKAPLEWVEETTHFFRLSQFQKFLLDYYEAHPETLQPTSRRNEVLSFQRSGLDDISISRELSWGIGVPQSVPAHENHSIYVWFEALMNYATAPGFLSDDEARRAHFAQVWPPDLQLMSKDIFTRFHATMWPAMLHALDLPLPKVLFSHGFWTVDGRKMSKREPETTVEPIAFAQEIASRAACSFPIGVDALRYYCLREVTFGSDGDFSRDGCFARYNADLANGLGNLVNRALSMLQQYFGGVVPETNRVLDLHRSALEATSKVEKAYENLEFHTALGEVWNIVSLGNRAIEDEKPWAKIKASDEESLAQVAALLRELLDVCAWCSVVLFPVMPHSMLQLRELLNISNELTWNDAQTLELFETGHVCRAPQPLFPRIQPKKPDASTKGKKMNSNENISSQDAPQNANAAAPDANANREMIVEAGIANHRTNGDESDATQTQSQSQSANAPAILAETPPDATPQSNFIEYADFAKIELRAAKILEAERVPKADKLLKLQVDLGTEKRQILAGIAQQFAPEELIGKTIVVVANLAPRTMRGLQSEGMLLAASATSDGPPAGLLTIDADVPAGSIIR